MPAQRHRQPQRGQLRPARFQRAQNPDDPHPTSLPAYPGGAACACLAAAHERSGLLPPACCPRSTGLRRPCDNPLQNGHRAGLHALAGGWVATWLFHLHHPVQRFFNASTWLTAIAGAAVLLLAYHLVTGETGAGPGPRAADRPAFRPASPGPGGRRANGHRHSHPRQLRPCERRETTHCGDAKDVVAAPVSAWCRHHPVWAVP